MIISSESILKQNKNSNIGAILGKYKEIKVAKRATLKYIFFNIKNMLK